MTKHWTPSLWGRTMTRSQNWHLRLQGLELSLTVSGKTYSVDIDEDHSYWLNRGFFWTDVTLHPDHSPAIKVDGLPNLRGDELTNALKDALMEKDAASVRKAHQIILAWLAQKSQQEKTVETERRWFTHEMQTAIEQARPSADVVEKIRELMRKSGVQSRLKQEADAIEHALTQWETDHRPFWASLNEAHTKRELLKCKDLFERVESKPLTEEQARAVICFDNRVQVIASAGSGKTSTMVAKAAYAIHRGFVAPERIVMLAFNKKAAEELAERAKKSFGRLGMKDVSVEASTFHALGLQIIGKATGERPDIPDWAFDTVSGLRKLGQIIQQLMERFPIFKKLWDLFRTVFGLDSPKTWDAQGGERIRTADGKHVRSQEEAILCNWLFFHGVNYCYEAPYEFKTATPDRRQYKPDFYYPDIDLYHEHFALDANGNAPPHFKGYHESIKWKRDLHQKHGTLLIETTSHQIRSGEAFESLERELTRHGIKLEFDPDRKVGDQSPAVIEPEALTQLVKTFISHFKSNCLTVEALHNNVDAMPEDAFKHQFRVFINIVEPIVNAWDAALAKENGIDFEDMLNLAAGYLESGRYEAPYELVMADEFQDASRARARLCRALVQKPGKHLFAVGDDWQSINRFAGADISVMTGFQELFGDGQVLKLEHTFRCPQELCDVSSRFISKNPTQIQKRVKSVTPTVGPALQAFQVDDWNKLTDAIRRFVEQLADGVRDGSIPPGRNGKISVYVLGRYRKNRQYLPVNTRAFGDCVDIEFLTIHRSKGSEADYVILPQMLNRAFPNTREDSPVLALAMPAGDDYLYAEERRLFYVALTRARRGVVMFTVQGKKSSFLQELEKDGAVSTTNTDGEVIHEEECPACMQGVIVLKTGRYGKFHSCSNYPDCQYKPRPRRTGNIAVEPAKNLSRNRKVMIS